MLQTLYKTASPTGPAINAEFYQLFLERRVVNGKRVFLVNERHGWWNDTQKQHVHLVSTLCPVEGLANYDEAEEIYQKQLQKRVSEGFTHSFFPDCCGADPLGFVYKNLADASA